MQSTKDEALVYPSPPAPAAPLRGKGLSVVVSGVGGFLAISLLAELSQSIGQALLIAPFGATCVLLFALPQSPLARPRNVIGGHLISAAIGIAVLATIGAQPLGYGLAVGLAIAAMQATGTLHPPAGADPIVVLLAGASWRFVAIPVLVGTVSLVLVAFLYHRFVSKQSYSLR